MRQPSPSHEYGILAELAEANMQLDFFAAGPAGLTHELGLEIVQTSSYTAGLVRAPDLAMYNSVQGIGLATPLTEAALDQIINRYAQLALDFSFTICPLSKPGALTEWLEKRGFSVSGRSNKFYRLPDKVAVPLGEGFAIQEVDTVHAADFAAIACRGLPGIVQPWLAATVGRVGWRHYMLSIGGQPAAVGSLYIHDGVGQFGWASTLPTFRRRGAQSALLAYRINECTRLGCHLLSVDAVADTLEKPNSSDHNIRRAGFELAHTRTRFVCRSHSRG